MRNLTIKKTDKLSEMIKSRYTKIHGHVARRIKGFRKKNGLTQKNLGSLLGLTQSQISKIENLEHIVNVVELCLIADALNVNITDFFQKETLKKNVKE